MKSAIHNVFGQDIQLSKATEEQQDLVELVIEEFKRIVLNYTGSGYTRAFIFDKQKNL